MPLGQHSGYRASGWFPSARVCSGVFLGLHLLRCDQVIPAGMLALGLFGDSIRERLMSRRKRVCQNSWLKQIQNHGRT